MSDELALRGNLDSIKKEAKRRLRLLRSSDPDERARLDRAYPGAPARPTLRDVQHVLAREHGFAGWADLKQAAERAEEAMRRRGTEALATYEAMSEALLEAYRTGTPEAMQRHYQYTWHRRNWQAMRTYTQLDLGKRPAHPGDDIEITLDDARHLIAREHGFHGWSELKAFTASRQARRRMAVKPVRIVRRHAHDEWETVASSRDWDEIVELLARSELPTLNAEGQMTDAVLADLPEIPAIIGLGLAGSRELTDEGLRHLAKLPALQHLDLGGTAITDAGLEVLRHLPHLRTLSLAWTRVTDRGMSALAHCHELEGVNLAATNAASGALRALAGKPGLRHLAIALGDAEMPLLHEIPAFKRWQGDEAELWTAGEQALPNRLSMRGSFSDRGMRHLRGLDGLCSLDIGDRQLALTADGLVPLTSLPRLVAVSVDAKDDWMPHISEMRRLRFLGVQDTTAGDDGFVALSRSQSIERIWGRRCHNLRTRGFTALARMPALRSLSVSCLNVEDGGIATLPAFPALRELMPMDIPDAGYRHIGRCESLESLILMYCRNTTDAATEQMIGLGRLTNYFNSYTMITDRTPELLSRMDSLERITFDSCHELTDAGIASLARLPRLRELRVSGRGITSAVGTVFPPQVRVIQYA